MALPAPGVPLSLNDIRIELQQASTNVSLGAMSNLVGFVDPDAVSEFYGFSYIAYNTFDINDTSHNEYVEACGFGGFDNKTLYFSGSGGTPACPAVGARLYTNTALSTVFNGGGLWWKSNQCNAAYNILSTGNVEAIEAC